MSSSLEPTRSKLELAIVIPVYNEEETILDVLQEWARVLEPSSIRFLFLILDDGSTDATRKKVQAFIEELPPSRKAHFQLVSQTNRGHGQTCLEGYRWALQAGIPYVFQIDSDSQCDPRYFDQFWSAREQAPALYGIRVRRDDGMARTLISHVLQWYLRFQTKTRLRDANVPYRLYRTSILAQALNQIPSSFHLANIAIALLVEPSGFAEIPIGFRLRQGGKASVKWWGYWRRARQLHRDLKTIPITVR